MGLVIKYKINEMVHAWVLTLVCITGWMLGWMGTSGTKSQTVRLLDIGVIGPLMIWGGTAIPSGFGVGFLLVFFGATTMTYNLRNYLTEAKKSNQE